MIDVAANVAAVRRRIARAAERARRDPSTVVLIAAAKTKSAALVGEAIAAGIADVGENYVQEAAVKRAQVTGPARWHMIGHLQRNKARRACEVFDVIQSVDDVALGEALSRCGEAAGRAIPVLIEVNLGGETSKSGVDPHALAEIATHLRALPHLAVQGLMAIPPPGAAAEDARPHFRRLRELRDRLELRELSMGMTDDFEVAIEEGATMVRVGRAIFGERER
jgi:pyridoxal phosphate enzyme (YggS family)